ncbi:MAG: methylmalonyl-CoA mutase small subunit [Planctomycetaceae bacterium]|nr:methylmalonyl-CoA mutase small subunit [Planctomycetaceae bacterium]
MLPEQFTILDDFPPVDYEQWRALVDESLQGVPFEKKLVTHTYEGIDVQPIYGRGDAVGGSDPLGFPGLPPFVRGAQPLGAVSTGWDLRQEHAHPDLAVTNQAILGDLKGGATSLLLRLDSAARNGLDPDQDSASMLAGRDGVMIYRVEDLDVALANVDLKSVAVAVESGTAFLPTAAILAALWQRRGVSCEDAAGAFNADPLAALARNGQLPVAYPEALNSLAELAKWTAHEYPRVTAVGVDTSPYHDAGATAAQDIAFGVATGVEYLRAMAAAGLDIDTAAGQILFRMGVGTHHFLAIAKLRAGRQLWSRVIEVSGGQRESGAMRIHARTSNRVLTQRDPYVNLLRNTVAAFASGLGGADVITSVPFDAMTGLPSEFSRRVARNTVLVLREESHLNRVVDPAGGSWFLDQLTEQLADKAWKTFQDIERQGGMLAALQGGWVASQIDAAYAPRAKDIARRKEGITGVSEFPDIAEQRVEQVAVDPGELRAAASARITLARLEDAAVTKCVRSGDGAKSHPVCSQLLEAALSGATIGQLARASGFHHTPTEPIPALEARSFAEPFEELRDASDAWQDAHGHRPRVFLANMGPVAHHTARAAYAKNFFEAGGFEVVGNEGFDSADKAAKAFADSGANIAVICSSDKLYSDFVPQVAPQLKQAGARSVILAGFPGDNAAAWQAAGVDRFIFIKCDVLETLRELLQEEGVLA